MFDLLIDGDGSGTYPSYSAALVALATIAEHTDLTVNASGWTRVGPDTVSARGTCDDTSGGENVAVWQWEIRPSDWRAV